VDAVIIDMHMPELSGEELGKRIKATPAIAHLPLMLLTSVAMRGDAERLLAAGFAAYLPKPVRGDLLQRALRSMFAPAGADQRPKLITRHQLNEACVHARILLVEDNATNQKLATALLRRQGHQVDVAANGVEALAALAQNDYKLVLMDCRMPVMDGFATTTAIRKGESGVRDPRVPIVAMTADAMGGDRERVLDVGMDDYLAKPIDGPRLAATVERWLGARSSVQVADGPSGAPSYTRVFDPRGVVAQFDGDRAMAVALLPEIVQSLFQETTVLVKALTDGDAALAARATHTAKGLTGSACAVVALPLMTAMEEAARRGELHAVRGQLAQWEASLRELDQGVRHWVAEPPRP
jgi:CheY-like chemotaxis protein